MTVLVSNRCEQCVALEKVHHQKMEHFIGLVECQSVLFRRGRARAAKDLDVAVRKAKEEREDALDALLKHSSDHNKAATTSARTVAYR